MANEISTIKTSDGVNHNIKDAIARSKVDLISDIGGNLQEFNTLQELKDLIDSQYNGEAVFVNAGDHPAMVLRNNANITTSNNIVIPADSQWFLFGHTATDDGYSGVVITLAGKMYSIYTNYPDTSMTINAYEYLKESDAQIKYMSSPATFVVNSDATLQAWANNTAGNDYSSVYIASGTYTLASGSINLTATGTKQIEGHPSSKLIFSSVSANDGNYAAAIRYTAQPTDPTYRINGLNIEVVGAPASSTNIYATGFKNCINLSNCSAYARSTGSKAYQAAYSFYGCRNLYNCFGASSGCNNGNAYTFSASSFLTNCTADETTYPATYDAQADIIPYASCSYCVNCSAKSKNGYELCRGYFGCSYLSGCTAECTMDASSTITEISGFCRCSRLSNCHIKITNNSGKTITNLGGVINSTMVLNTVSEGAQMYNSSHLFGNNATAYTSCYSDDYTTAVADTPAGGFNHIGILTWKNNHWENA